MLVLGLDPFHVPGGWDPQPKADEIEVGRARFVAEGLPAEFCLFGTDGSVDIEMVVTDALRSRRWECVVVGGGVRHDDLLFEQVINLVHRHAPGAAIAVYFAPNTDQGFSGTPAARTAS